MQRNVLFDESLSAADPSNFPSEGLTPMDVLTQGRRLNGWKEIGSYLGRVVRTAQRWETLGMPVHRPATKKRTAVIAFPHELDSWLVRNRPRLDLSEPTDTAASITDLAALTERLDRLQREATMLAREIERARGELPTAIKAGSTELMIMPERPD
jgi:hypothetical protein